MACAYCAVRNESKYNSGNISLQGLAMSLAVSRWPLTLKIRVRFQANICEILGVRSSIGTGFSSGNFRQIYVRFWVYEVALGQVFLLVILLSSVIIFPRMLPTHLREYVALTGRRNNLRLGNVLKSDSVVGIRKAFTRSL
jgi:hypothetical protein